MGGNRVPQSQVDWGSIGAVLWLGSESGSIWGAFLPCWPSFYSLRVPLAFGVTRSCQRLWQYGHRYDFGQRSASSPKRCVGAQ